MEDKDKKKIEFSISQIKEGIIRCDKNVEIFTKKADEQKNLREELIIEKINLEKMLRK